MAEWLVLRLARGAEERVSFMAADVRGQPLGAPQSGSLQQAAGAAAGRRLAVVVPSSDVLVTQVELPVKSGVRVQQVVPYALEEQLAADIETLHFAVGAREESSGRTTVAVVTRALMQQWLDALQAVGLSPDVLCTEAALLPDNPGHVVVMLESDTLWVHRSGQPPLTLPAADLAAVLSAALGAEMSADNLILYVSPEDWQRRSAEVEALRAQCSSLKVQLLNFGPLPLLAAQLPSGAYLNLLSGDYAPKRTFGAGWQRWRLAAGLAAALFAVHVSGLALQLHQQRHAEQALGQAIDAIGDRALSGHPPSDEVRGLVERRLLSAQEGGSGGLMPALALVAQALEGATGTSIQSLSYSEQGLQMTVRSTDATQLERINEVLRSNGWQAQLTSGQATAAGYEGRIQARAPGAGAAR
jgi:general secretion pathway protein L